MKDLSKFQLVQEALKQVVADADVNNGTANVVFHAHFWEQEFVYDKDRVDLQNTLARKILSGTNDEIDAVQAQLKALGRPKIMMVWKLLDKIPILNGTKTRVVGDKQYKLVMNDVDTLYIHENCVHRGLLEYEETEDIGKDKMGRDAKIVKLRLKKGIIDVAAPAMYKGKEVKPKRAMVSEISFKALQTVGSFDANMANILYGYEQIS